MRASLRLDPPRLPVRLSRGSRVLAFFLLTLGLAGAWAPGLGAQDAFLPIHLNPETGAGTPIGEYFIRVDAGISGRGCRWMMINCVSREMHEGSRSRRGPDGRTFRLWARVSSGAH